MPLGVVVNLMSSCYGLVAEQKRMMSVAGHASTTGIPTMDYFVSYKPFELPHAQDFYSEKLVRSDVVATLGYVFKRYLHVNNSLFVAGHIFGL